MVGHPLPCLDHRDFSGTLRPWICPTIRWDPWAFAAWYGCWSMRSRETRETKSWSHWMGWTWMNRPFGYGSIPIDTFLVGWTSIYQLFWGSLGTRVLTHPHFTEIDLWAKMGLNYPFYGDVGDVYNQQCDMGLSENPVFCVPMDGRLTMGNRMMIHLNLRVP